MHNMYVVVGLCAIYIFVVILLFLSCQVQFTLLPFFDFREGARNDDGSVCACILEYYLMLLLLSY